MIALTVITFCTIWLADVRVWRVCYLVLLIWGLLTSSITWLALLPVSALFCLLCLYLKEDRFSIACLVLIVVLGLALGLHVVPGFNNVEYLKSVSLSASAAEFDVWFNYDKSLFGLFVLGTVLHSSLIRSKRELFRAMRCSFAFAFFGIGLIYLTGLMLGYSKLDWTPTWLFLPWALKNLIFTVLAEEALFRGLLQRELSKRFSTGNVWPHLAVLMPALLFGLAHFAGGLQYVLLSSMAGVLYGYVYKWTGRIEAPIATHFLLNAGHFLFFAYPYAI